MTIPEYVEDLDFRSPVEVAKTLVPVLKKENDILIALTHMGHYQNAQHGTLAPGDVTLARSVKGIDIIVGGHSQNPLFKPDIQNGTYILQAYEWVKYIGRLDLEFRNGELKVTNYRLIPVNLKKKVKKNGKTAYVFMEKEIPEDPEVLKALGVFQKAGEKLTSEVVGLATGKFEGDRNIIRGKQTNLGQLVAKAMMQITNADVSLYNSGSIRVSIENGPITYKDVLMVHPFGNTITTVEMTGKKLRDYLELALNKTVGDGGYPQIAGVHIVMKANKIQSLKINGKKLGLKKKYKLAVPSFVAAGGDKYPVVTSHPSFVDTGHVAASVLKKFIQDLKKIRPKDFIANQIVVQK